MKTLISTVILSMVAVFLTSDGCSSTVKMGEPCSDAWYQYIEQKVSTGDGQGHGPDLGSDEWKSVIEFKLGVRGAPNLPERGSDAWCRHIDKIVQERAASSSNEERSAMEKKTIGPSYDCNKVQAGSIEALVCQEDALSALDRKLASVYAHAAKKATNEQPPMLKAEQRGWIKGRDDCWKSEDPYECVRQAYIFRIAELQARYRLVPANGPVRFACNGDPADEIRVTFFQTDPPTLIAERGDSVSLMVLKPSASGSKYAGGNETFWEHQGEALVTWGWGAPQMQCKKVE